MRCFEILSGSPLTEKEENAEKPSQINSMCPAWLIPATFLLISLAACSPAVKQIDIVSKPLERVPLDLPPVDIVTLDDVNWIIVTEENVESVWEDLQKKKYSIVIFGLTDKGYEDLSVNMAKLQKLVKQQKAVIAAYKRYYEQTDKAIQDQNKKSDSEKNEVNTSEKSILDGIKGLFK